MTPLHQAIELLFGPRVTRYDSMIWSPTIWRYEAPGIKAEISYDEAIQATRAFIHAWKWDRGGRQGDLELFYFTDPQESPTLIAQEILEKLTDFFESEDLA